MRSLFNLTRSIDRVNTSASTRDCVDEQKDKVEPTQSASLGGKGMDKLQRPCSQTVKDEFTIQNA